MSMYINSLNNSVQWNQHKFHPLNSCLCRKYSKELMNSPSLNIEFPVGMSGWIPSRHVWYSIWLISRSLDYQKIPTGRWRIKCRWRWCVRRWGVVVVDLGRWRSRFQQRDVSRAEQRNGRGWIIEGDSGEGVGGCRSRLWDGLKDICRIWPWASEILSNHVFEFLQGTYSRDTGTSCTPSGWSHGAGTCCSGWQSTGKC